MAKAAFLLPYPGMCDMIRPMLPEFRHITPVCIEYLRTEEIESRVQQLVQDGCDLFVARGLQAMLIQKCTQIPLVQIRITSQELGVIVLALREKVQREKPVLALVGFANMFSDTSHFDELFDIRLRRYMVIDENDLAQTAELAARKGADALIGGEVVCEVARELGVPNHFLSAGTGSLCNALVLAEHTGRTIDLEKHNSAEISLIFDNTHFLTLNSVH